MKKVLICGDRNWSTHESIQAYLHKLQEIGYDTIIEGGARGADRIAEQEGRKLGLTILEFPAEWNKYGRAAGFIRNTQMLVEGQPELVVAFHPNIKESKGTANMVQQATKAGIPTVVFDS